MFLYNMVLGYKGLVVRPDMTPDLIAINNMPVILFISVIRTTD